MVVLTVAVGAIVALSGAVAIAAAPQGAVPYAITGATVIVRPGTAIESATVVIRDGLIEAVGAEVAAPADARVIDGTDMTVYAGWIDAYSTIALRQQAAPQPQQRPGGGGGQAPAQEPEVGTGHPITRIHPEYSVTEDLIADDSDIESHREAGFTAALVVPQDGIYRGGSALIALREGSPRDLVIDADVAQVVSFQSGRFGGGYPGSLIGVLATFRQVLLDAQRWATWQDRYEQSPAGIQRPPQVDAYPALMPVLAGERPVLFEASNNRMTERALRLAQEFAILPIIKGNGAEYDATFLFTDAGAPVIVPVDYPKEPGVDDPDAAVDVTLETLRRWDQAAGNAAALESAGISFAFTADGVGPGSFAENVRKAIEAGLSEDVALAAVTTKPAEILGVEAILGTVEAGKIANVVVATGAPFGEDSEVRHVFVDGHHSEIEARPARGGGRGGDESEEPVDPRGTWLVTSSGEFQMEMTWTITGSPGSYDGTVSSDMGVMSFDRVRLRGASMSANISMEMGEIFFDVFIEGDELSGSMAMGDMMTMDITGKRTSGPGARATSERGGLQ
jgi:imidazolonepropionase-like amidohydrolase